MVNCFRSNSYYNLKKTLSLILLFYHYPTAKVRKKKRIYNLFIIKKAYFVYNYGVDSTKKNSLSPNPSPNGEGSENHCLQIKGASRWCKERLSWIGRNALLKWRRAFPSFYSFVITILVTMLVCLNNMSFKKYVTMSLCLKHPLPSTLILCFYV